MGRILDALKHSARRHGEENGAPLVPQEAVPTEPAPISENEEAIPFIEVGPHRSMEGSPDVLAKPARKEAELKPIFDCPRLIEAPTEIERSPSPTQCPDTGLSERIVRDPLRIRRPRFADELISYHQPEHALSQQYRRLIQQLVAPSAKGPSRVMLFTSARPGCGTTTVLLNMAITAARDCRKRVVVVDGNLRRPALAERLGLGEVSGLREVLAGGLPLEQALQETDQADLYALPAGKLRETDGIHLRYETIRSMLRQLRQRFDMVLVDGPRWDGQPDVVSLGTSCDAVYLVVSEDEAESAQVDELYQRIPERGANLAGCILA